ncbi:MAG: ATP-dependent DNA helicase RecG [Rhodospirillales bacterium]|nr:ATP-dependent DNA helicase RecG [Rhodospirillales bacterium]MCB9979832.1 ATP-dependent DNA helicase RecG [Rhodospirillales bacterium]
MRQRPFILDPLFRPVSLLPGVGPRNLARLEKLTGGTKVLDVLWHLPIDLIDRRSCPKIHDVKAGQVVTLKVSVQKHFPPQKRGAPYRVWCSDETGALTLVFFHARPDWVLAQLPEGQQKIVSGKIEAFHDGLQMVHPDAIGDLADLERIAVYEPVYPLTEGLSNKMLRKVVEAAAEQIPTLPEWQEPSILKREGWTDWKTSLRHLHQPEEGQAILPESPDRRRLAYDELLANQLALALVRQSQRKSRGRALDIDRTLRQKFLELLPFTLTSAQCRVMEEIDADMTAPLRMLRLLQGDVGSGKTVVAVMALLNAVSNGLQGALMAPTEILARQHAETLAPWLEALGVPFLCLTGRDKGKKREALLQQIVEGAAKIVIGTHSLFQETILFQALGVAVIDEQHRFGVHQRLKLSEKGKGVDVLVMTATPIPRTLTLTAYGDMEVSRLDEKPPGRKSVDTRLIAADHLDQMIEGVRKEIEKGIQVYWVCPLVAESEVMDLAAAEERAALLQQFFGDRVGLVHGQMKPEEKDAVMQRFMQGACAVLVATTVIEVGVNVPNAAIMVIEHAERFGLAQLHQLRGRVGRGAAQSFCFLMYDGPLSETAKERLSIMRQTEDGFLIAEKDLELRGAGDILGTKQSGVPHFRVADLEHHKDLLEMARDEARLILHRDPKLEQERGQNLKTLLYLFERDQAIGLLKSG